MTPQTAIFVLQLALAIWGAFAAPADSQYSDDGIYGNGTYTFEDIVEQLQDMTDPAAATDIGERVGRSSCLTSPAYGGTGGAPFQDVCDSRISQIKTFRIGVGNYQPLGVFIKTVQVTYKLDDGSLLEGLQHGLGSQEHVFDFADGEKIIAVVGRYDALRLRQLAFLTEDSTGGRHVKGPVGSDTVGSSFIVNHDIYGIYGRSGHDIDSLGFFYR